MIAILMHVLLVVYETVQMSTNFAAKASIEVLEMSLAGVKGQELASPWETASWRARTTYRKVVSTTHRKYRTKN